jgi:hypothetical protein
MKLQGTIGGNARRYSRWLMLVIATLAGCVDPFPVSMLHSGKSLVVDAVITDTPGPHTVTLSYTGSLSNNYTVPEWVSGASVMIINEIQDTVFLSESVTGKYLTPLEWRAMPGRQYTLHIHLSDGRQYQSDVQQLIPAGEISNIYYRFLENSIHQNDPSKPQHAVGIYIDARGVSGSSSLLRWRWSGVYEIETHPELRTRFEPSCFCQVPDPPPCAGAPCTCCNCWVTEYSRTALVSANQFVSNSKYAEVLVAKIPIDEFRFFSKYRIEVQQLGLPESAYSFWKLVQAQQAGSVDLFQPNVIKIRGNVRSVSDSNEKVFGVVEFASVVSKTVEVYQHQIPRAVPPIPLIRDDCRKIFRNSSNVRPPFW